MRATHAHYNRIWRLLPCLLLGCLGLPSLAVAEPAAEAAQLDTLRLQVAGLEQRVQRLRDVESIEILISAYGYYLDKALWDQVTDLFSEDGLIEISQRGVYQGKARILASMDLYGPQGLRQQYLHNHIQLQPLITISEDGQTAWSRHRALSQLGNFGRDGVLSGGIYENEYVKENGVWKFKKDHVYTTFFSLYEDGFTGGRPAAMPSKEIPPDLPATESYAAFPDVYLPAFHYRHPVTGRAIGNPVHE